VTVDPRKALDKDLGKPDKEPRPGQIRADYSGHQPNCNAAPPGPEHGLREAAGLD